jgi:hypothetical protein
LSFTRHRHCVLSWCTETVHTLILYVLECILIVFYTKSWEVWFRAPLSCNWDIHSSWMLCNVNWLLVTDVAEPVGCTETSATNNQSVLPNIPHEAKSHVKSEFIPTFVEKICMHFSSYWLLTLLRQVVIHEAEVNLYAFLFLLTPHALKAGCNTWSWGKFVALHATKTQRGEQYVQLHSFLTSALELNG